MAYIVIEASVRTHHKFLKAGPAASWLWTCGLGYCQDGLTDGFIPKSAIEFLGVKGATKLVPRLVEARLWEELPDGSGWQMHDYLHHNKSADEVRNVMRKRSAGGHLGGRPRKTLEVTDRETLMVNHQGKPSRETSSETSSGETRNVTENPLLPSGTSGTTGTDQEQRAVARESHAVLVKIAHGVLDEAESPDIPDGELCDRLKDCAAKARIPYDSRACQKALDAARGHRARRFA